MADTTSTSTFRPAVYGSGITVLTWAWQGKNEQVIAFAQDVTVRVPQPVSTPVAVQPLNQMRPVEIVTAQAQGHGEIDVNLTQLYNYEAWQRLAGLANSQDIADICRTVAGQSGGIMIKRLVTPPLPNFSPYYDLFYNCQVASIGDDQLVDVTTMIVNKMITFWYTHYTKSYINGGKQQYDTPTVDGIPTKL